VSTATRSNATIGFSVNGEPVELVAPGGRRLLDVLRADLRLTGTKEGCGEGECGACTVLVDGEVALSCLIPVAQVAGSAVRTIEGMGSDGRLEPLQQTFLETGAAQCGICTPWMLMTARAYLDEGGGPDEAAIREAIAGNLCRCTGYTKIVDAIALAAEEERTGGEPDRTSRPARRIAADTSGPPLLTPRTLAEAVDLLAGTGARPIAGGTDVMVGLAAGALPGDGLLLDLRGLDELRGIDRADGELVLGALTTYTDLRRSALAASVLPVLADVAATIGARQIQNRGTIGGNVVNASPAGDMLPVLLATDATIDLVGPRGERSVPASEFWIGYRRTARAADELVTRIRVPLVEGRRVRYRKVGTRRAQAISKVVLAAAWREDGRAWRDVRIGVGSVAEVPIRARATEAALEGAVAGPDTAERAAAAIEGEVRPIDDVRSTAVYRRTVTGRVLRRMVLDEADRQEPGAPRTGEADR
jgi:xanthine dehydrogenase small subunit